MIKKIGLQLARTEIFVFALFWLMVLVVAGTLAQRNMGLYGAQQIFFSSFIYWIGFIPTPGGYTTMGVIFVGLLAKLVFDSSWQAGKAGILVTHIGALLLLLGGFLTAAFSQEGVMIIPPGQSVDFFSDYHSLELSVTASATEQEDEVTAFSQGWLKPGKLLKSDALPFQIEVLKFLPNTRMEKRTAPASADLRGFLTQFDLLAAPAAKESEQNRAGVLFKVKSAGAGQDGTYAIFDEMPIQQTLDVQGKKFVLEIRRARTHLPFKIHLLQFEKKVHPGTSMAKSYKSVVNLEEGGVTQRAVVQMNEPLRHKGFTFYQSSFIEHPQGDTTVLSVVKNAGRTFPYISSIIMCIGLLIHLVIQSPKLIRKRTEEV